MSFYLQAKGSLLQTKVGRWAVLRLLRTRSFRSTRWTTAEVRSCCVRRALHIPSPPINSKWEVNSARRLSARQSQLPTLSPHWTTGRKGVAPVPMLSAGILAGVLGLALGAHGAPGTAAVQPNTFQEVRVCAYEAFSLRQQRCTRDQRTQLLVSSRFGCSVIFDVRQRATFRNRPDAHASARIVRLLDGCQYVEHAPKSQRPLEVPLLTRCSPHQRELS